MDPDDLAEVIGNLAENAARYARRTVSIGARRDDQTLSVTVTDDGPGIALEKLEGAQLRGAYLDKQGGGAGLGLAIVREITEAWGGRLTLEPGAGGLVATLKMPDHN